MKKNWYTIGVWMPIETLSSDYTGPVVFADKSQAVQWFAEKADRSAVTHVEHARDPETNEFLFVDGQPKLKKGKAVPAFWQPATLVEVES